MKTIIRVNRDQYDHIVLMFQKVDHFNVLKRENIQYCNDADISSFSEWLGYSDLIDCNFTSDHNLTYTLNLHYKHDLECELHARSLNSYQLDQLKKEISQFKRIEKSVQNDLELINKYLSNVDNDILLSILFKRFNVIGGTLDISNTKTVFNGCNKSAFIDQIIGGIS